MAYVQSFGVNRTSPVAFIGQNTMKKYSKKPEESNKKPSDSPATDIIDKQNIKASEEKNRGFLDYVQDGLTVVGMIPFGGNVADLINVGISGARAGYAGLTGDKSGVKKHLGNVALSGLAAVPGIGIGAGGAKLAKNIKAVDKAVGKGAEYALKTYKGSKLANQYG